jgi:transcriptional regulator with XRE-family HTH domain
VNEQQFLEKIGANIDRIRKQRGFTIQELAQAVGTEKGNLHPLLKGQSNMKALSLFALANALECDVKEFFK